MYFPTGYFVSSAVPAPLVIGVTLHLRLDKASAIVSSPGAIIAPTPIPVALFATTLGGALLDVTLYTWQVAISHIRADSLIPTMTWITVSIDPTRTLPGATGSGYGSFIVPSNTKPTFYFIAWRATDPSNGGALVTGGWLDSVFGVV